MVLTLALLVLILTLFNCWIKYNLNYWKSRGIPHEEPSLLFGNLGLTHWSRAYQRVYEKYKVTGPFVGFYHFFTKAAVILEPELAHNILVKDFHNYSGRGLYKNQHNDPLSVNLLTMEGIRWHQIRHKMTPAFTANKLKLMSITIDQISRELVEYLQEEMNGEKIKILNLFDLMCRVTTDVIGNCGFGLVCNSIKNLKADFFTMAQRSLHEPRQNIFIDGIIQSFPQLAQLFDVKLMQQDVSAFYIITVREILAYRERNHEKRNDWLNNLIEMNKNIESELRLSVEEIAAQTFLLLTAGVETTGTTMTMVLYELAQNQHIQDKARLHIEEILKPYSYEMCYDSMQEMNYLDMIINETLRKHSPTPFLIRKATERYETSQSNYYIEPGSLVIVPVSAIHLDSEYYAEPKKFIPERFTTEEIQKRPPYTFLPFGAGPRMCIAHRFARMQLIFCLTYLIRYFRFNICSKTEIPYDIVQRSILSVPKNGIFLSCEEIQL